MIGSKLWVVAVLFLLACAGCGEGSGQSPECQRYLTCVQKLAGSSASLDSDYGPSGTCWNEPARADACAVKCKAALAAFPAESGC